MNIFKLNGEKLSKVEYTPFKLEKDIQKIVEKNSIEVFNLTFIQSEFSLGKYRLDSICFNEETNSFVIIEYKNGKSYSVIDQGYTYLQLLLNNKSDFILLLSQFKNKVLKIDDVDWSQTRIIFISPSFNSYQKDSVNFKDLPFELWEIKKYKDNLIGLLQHITDSEESIMSVSPDTNSIVSQVSKEVKVYSEEYLVNKSESRPQWIIELYNILREKLLNLGDVEIKPNGKYLSFRVNKRPFVDLVFYNSGIYTIINLKEGKLNDPKKIMSLFNGKGHWGNGDYYVTITQNIDIDEMIYLIQQSYKDKL